MIVALVLTLAIGVGSGLPPPAPLAVAAIPDEPGAVMLPERPTYQAVVADLDGRGVRDVVRLVLGNRGTIVAEVWRHRTDGWGRVGQDVEVIPRRTPGTQANFIFGRTPARLIVRTVGDRDHVTVVRQPRFEEPGTDPCCLLLHDLVIVGGEPQLRSVAPAADVVDAVIALDLDGDGTDELLAMRSLPPLGRTSFPSEALVYRWQGDAFGPPTLTELAVGSGDAPFVLGDSDGRPGMEAGIITTSAQGVLHRLVLDDDDRIRAEDSRIVTTEATAVSLGDGRRGIAVIGPVVGLSVHAWPPGETAGPSEANRPGFRGRLFGTIDFRGGPVLALSESGVSALHLLTLPMLLPVAGAPVTRTPAAGRLASSPLRPYAGLLPRGGPDGAPMLHYEGRLLPVEDPPEAREPREVTPTAALPGIQPVGLAGRGREWIALFHGTGTTPALSPSGGRLEAPTLRAASGLSLAPLALVAVPELGQGRLEPAVLGAVPVTEGGALAVGSAGFQVEVVAPPGARVYASDADPSVTGGVRIVPAPGRLTVSLPPPSTNTPNPRYRATLSVVTPAGRGYVATFEARHLTDPPPLAAAADTAVGSVAVDVRGSTAPWASVVVDGRPIEVAPSGEFHVRVDLPPWPTEVRVVATDPLGNESAVSVTGIGLIDYRGLPWLPIALILLGAAAIVLYLRVPAPRPSPAGRRADDDATLEELEPD